MQLDEMDLQWCVRCLPKDVRNLMRTHLPRLVVAGGYIRALIAGEKPSDIDIFVPSPEVAKTAALKLLGLEPGNDLPKTVVKTANALTIPRKDITVQFITRWTFDDVGAVIQSFDFTIAAAALWCDASGWHSLCNDRFYMDLAAKRLVYRSPARNEDAGGSMLRVLKFYQRGYRIPLPSMGAVIARLMKGVKWEAIHTHPENEQEMQLAKVLTGLLVQVDPNTFNPLGRIIDADDEAIDLDTSTVGD